MSHMISAMAYSFVIEILLQPLAFGAAGFVLGFRINRSVWTKLLLLLVAVVAVYGLFQWWSFHLIDSPGFGDTRHDHTIAEYQAGAPLGEERSLQSVEGYSFYDAIELLFIVPLGYLLAMLLTRRRWNEDIGPVKNSVAADSPFARVLFPGHTPKPEALPLPPLPSLDEPPPLPDWVLPAVDPASYAPPAEPAPPSEPEKYSKPPLPPPLPEKN